MRVVVRLKHVPDVGMKRNRQVNQKESDTEHRSNGYAQAAYNHSARPSAREPGSNHQRLEHGAHRGRHFQPAIRNGEDYLSTDDYDLGEISPQPYHRVLMGVVNTENENAEAVIQPKNELVSDRQRNLNQRLPPEPGSAQAKAKR